MSGAVCLTGQSVREDFTFTRAGIYFTLSLPLKIGSNVLKDKLQIALNTSLSYLLFIHDPEYFLFNDNPIAIPGERRRLDTNEANPKKWHYRLELVEVNKLNLPTSPCNDDPSYSFVTFPHDFGKLFLKNTQKISSRILKQVPSNNVALLLCPNQTLVAVDSIFKKSTLFQSESY